MNKKDLAIVAVLILLIPVVLEIDRRFIKPRMPEPPPPPPAPEQVDGDVATPTPRPARALEDMPEVAIVERELPPAPEPGEEAPAVERETFVLANDHVQIEIDNHGAGILLAKLKRFPHALEDHQVRRQIARETGVDIYDVVWTPGSDWNPVSLDFSSSPALVYQVRGMNESTGFEAEWIEPSRSLRLTPSRLPGGLVFRRTLTLEEDGYIVTVVDTWENHSSNAEGVIPELPLWLGPMLPLEGVSQRFGPFLGVDARYVGGVNHFVKDITRAVRRADGMVEESVSLNRLDWFTAKNKFFTQVLTPVAGDHPNPGVLMWRAEPGTGDARIGMVQSGARIAGGTVEPGQSVTRAYQFYVGPIRTENLRELGMEQHGMIDVRLWRVFVPLGKLMLSGLNGLYAVVNNWGLAIILLTVVVRMLFWPLTAKGAENMRRMSELSPQMKEIREKYKSNPQKMNQAMSAFYKENKVNPMAGCLPMFVQIPVFFSLYGALRIAVELRFAEFLWVRDLSEPEHLFHLFGFPVNILPLTMGATMILQQRMTPSGSMDEQQRKIMMMMPVIFLMFTYNMPSGLLLYWTTSNLISIYQSWHTRRKQAAKTAAAPAPAPVKGKSAPPAKSPPKRKPAKKGGKR